MVNAKFDPLGRKQLSPSELATQFNILRASKIIAEQMIATVRYGVQTDCYIGAISLQ